MQAGLENARDKTPYSSSQETEDQSSGNQEPSRPRVKSQGKPSSRNSAENDLSLSADIDHVGTKCNTDSQTYQQQGGGLHQRLRNPRNTTRRAVNQCFISGDRISL